MRPCCLCKFCQYLNVAETHHHKSNQEENILLVDCNVFPQNTVVFTSQRPSVIVVNLVEGTVEQGRCGCSNANDPDYDRQYPPSADPPCAQVREWEDHSYIPVDSHSGQEEDAAVKPGEEDKSHKFADNF